MLYCRHKKATASLNAGLDLQAAVRLPEGEDVNEWLAVHVVDFFNRINLIYGTVCDFCTDESCPRMSGGPQYEYQWADGSVSNTAQHSTTQHTILARLPAPAPAPATMEGQHMRTLHRARTFLFGSIITIRPDRLELTVAIVLIAALPFYAVQAYKKPTSMPAPKYIGLLMDWTEALINDDST